MKIEEFKRTLQSIYILLDSICEDFWSEKVKKLAEKDVKKFSSRDIEEVLSWFGGMGSINDLLISHYNGHDVTQENENKKNDELDFLRDAIYEQAVTLRKDLS